METCKIELKHRWSSHNITSTHHSSKQVHCYGLIQGCTTFLVLPAALSLRLLNILPHYTVHFNAHHMYQLQFVMNPQLTQYMPTQALYLFIYLYVTLPFILLYLVWTDLFLHCFCFNLTNSMPFASTAAKACILNYMLTTAKIFIIDRRLNTVALFNKFFISKDLFHCYIL